MFSWNCDKHKKKNLSLEIKLAISGPIFFFNAERDHRNLSPAFGGSFEDLTICRRINDVAEVFTRHF